jgi:hypothetical protein
MSSLPGAVEPGAFHDFELTVAVDQRVYAQGQPVRLTVSAANTGERSVEHVYPGWQRVVVTVRDERHRAVATDDLGDHVPGEPRATTASAVDRWLPGQALLLPSWWDQRRDVVRPAWRPAGDVPGERVEPGRYRVRATWLGREPGGSAPAPEAWSNWFELV